MYRNKKILGQTDTIEKTIIENDGDELLRKIVDMKKEISKGYSNIT